MADQITQTLGFDAGQALDTLSKLDSGFATFESRVNSVSSGFTNFNRNAGKTVSALKQITSNAKTAADELQRLSKIAPPKTPSVNVGAPAAAAGGSQQLLQGQAAATAMNALLGQTAKQANAAASALNNVGNSAANNMNRGRKAVSGFAISFETLVRVVTTQVIVRAFAAIRGAISDAFENNLEFIRSLSEIRTLANGINLDRLGDEIRGVSDAFNIPLLDVAHAKYEILSNGFQGAAESQQVLTASSKFAKTAIASTADSVDVITGTLNAFSLSADEAELVAAKLFRTVDQGKVVGSELARGLGRISPVAKELGVTLDEELAALSTITKAGVPASEALTQIRAAFTALIKPSDAAKEAFQKLNVENGVQLVRAKGLQGAYQALIGTTDGQVNSIARLVPNVRALNAVLRLTGSGVEEFQRILSSIETTDVGEFSKIFAERVSTDAEKVEADLNKLKNFLTVELGRDLVKAFRNLSGGGDNLFSNFVGGAGGVDGLIAAIRSLIPIVTLGVGALAGYGAILATISLQSKLASVDLDGLKRPLFAVTKQFTDARTAAGLAQAGVAGLQAAFNGLFLFLGAQAAGEFIGQRFNQVISGVREGFNQERDRILSAQEAADQKVIDKTNKTTTRIGQLFSDLIAKKRGLYFEDVDAAKTANEALVASSSDVLDRIIEARNKFANDLKRAADESGKAVLDSQKRQLDAEASLEDRRFNFQNQRFKQSVQLAKLLQRSEQLASQAQSKLASASSSDETNAALGEFRRAQAFADQAASIADQTGNLGLKLRAEQAIEGVLTKQIAAEKQLQALKDADRKKAEKAAAEEEARVGRLKNLAKDFLKSSSFFGKDGKPLSADKIEAKRGEAQAALDKFFAEASKGSKFDVSDLFAFDQLQKRLQENVTDAEIRNLRAAPQALDQLKSQIQGTFEQTEFILNLVPNPEKLKGLSASEIFEGADQQVKDNADRLVQLRNNAVEASAAMRKIKAETLAIGAEFETGKTAVGQFFTGFLGGASASQEQLKLFKSAFAQLRKETEQGAVNPNFGSAQLDALVKKSQALANVAPKAFNIDLGNLAAAQARLNTIVQTREKAAQTLPKGSLQELTQLQSQSGQLLQKIGQASQETGDTAASADKAKTAFSTAVSPTGKIADNAERAARGMERAAVAAERAAAARALPGSSTEDVEERARGGMVGLKHFDKGGFVPHGTDTQLTALTPGEGVLTDKATRKFFSQVTAMNAGIDPVFRQDSGAAGDTFHIHGDINVNESQRPHQTSRDLMNAVRRERRRGTGKIS